MACRLFGTKLLSKQMVPYCKIYTYKHNLQWNFDFRTIDKFIPEIALENVVCKISAIFPLSECDQYFVKQHFSHKLIVAIVTLYGDIELVQHWPMLWLVTLQHQASNRTNIDISPVSRLRFSGSYLSSISQEIPQPSITGIRLKIAYLKKIIQIS